jgi:hypothetical protein
MRILRGTVTSQGFGIAGDNLLPLMPLILERTGFGALAKGTLNLALPEPYIVTADAQLTGQEYFSGETIKLQRCVVRGLRALIMRPETHETIPGFGHGPAHLELMSEHHLTSTLMLMPGAELDVEVEGDAAWWSAAH